MHGVGNKFAAISGKQQDHLAGILRVRPALQVVQIFKLRHDSADRLLAHILGIRNLLDLSARWSNRHENGSKPAFQAVVSAGNRQVLQPAINVVAQSGEYAGQYYGGILRYRVLQAKFLAQSRQCQAGGLKFLRARQSSKLTLQAGRFPGALRDHRLSARGSRQ